MDQPDKQTTGNGKACGCRGIPGPGRPKGSTNKVGRELRVIISEFVEHNAQDAQALFDRVKRRSPGTALRLLIEMQDFVLPRLQRTEIKLPPPADAAATAPAVTVTDVLAAFHAAPPLPAPVAAPAAIAPPPTASAVPRPIGASAPAAQAAATEPPTLSRAPRPQREEPVIDVAENAEGVWSAPQPAQPNGVHVMGTEAWRRVPADMKPIGQIPTAAELRAAMLLPPATPKAVKP